LGRNKDLLGLEGCLGDDLARMTGSTDILDLIHPRRTILCDGVSDQIDTGSGPTSPKKPTWWNSKSLFLYVITLGGDAQGHFTLSVSAGVDRAVAPWVFRAWWARMDVAALG